MPKSTFSLTAAAGETGHATVQDAILSNTPLFARAIRRGLEILDARAVDERKEQPVLTSTLPDNEA